ncbi:MAG: hypothetical protein ACFCUX_03785 [Candidatus Methylacidiphilales bacterium]
MKITSLDFFAIRHVSALLALLWPIGCGSSDRLPADKEYVVVQDSQLTINGQPQRFWSVIGSTFFTPEFAEGDDAETRAEKVAEARRRTDELLDRLDDLGFNSVRMWQASLWNAPEYTPGDGSRADMVDYYIARVKEKGWRIWMPGFNRAGSATPDDVSVIDDPATAEAWRAAVASEKESKTDLRHSLARTWDPRLEALYAQRIEKIATHFNQHTGLRWSDDPVFGVWELTNEEWWMTKMINGRWQQLPEYFRADLVGRWNAWVRAKYSTDESLLAAWGSVLPGESLVNNTLLLAPMAGKTVPASANDSNPHALAALEGLAQEYKRSDFPEARGRDVYAFLIELQMAHKKRMHERVKTFGKSCRLSPLIYDTGIGYEIQSAWLHQNAEAVAHDAYVNGWGPLYEKPDTTGLPPQRAALKEQDAERISANTGPWVNWLLKPPGISQGVPWLEHNRVEGKPFLCYEVQIQQPAKYRADFPYRLAALASIQDWSWICWHYFGPASKIGKNENPFDQPMDITVGQHPQGYHYTYDEVQNSAMRNAAHLFRSFALPPAQNPTRFIYGRRSLHETASMDYAGSYGMSGVDMLHTTYQHGVRIHIDPNREEDEVIGPVVRYVDRHTHNPYTPTPNITFDWKKGFLRMDSPQGVVFTGLLARVGNEVEFNNGVRLHGVTIINDEGIFDPVTPEENYLAFSLASRDGQPLEKSADLLLSLVSTSFNSGFDAPRDDMTAPGSGRIAVGKIKGGTTPVLHARVGGSVTAPFLKGMHYRMLDWHLREIHSGTLESDSLTIPADMPIFSIELAR